jgi:glycosyltransferase involved in cell wall biosynthesis
VRSILNQTKTVTEIVLVDDCSDDGTSEVLETLHREHGERRVKLVSLSQNMGPGSARNAGWEIAQGEYVAFLDADDVWHPRKIELQLAFMRARPEFAFTGHAHDWLRTPGSESYQVEDQGFDPVPLRWLLSSNPLAPSAVMIRRSVAFRFPDRQRYMEDHLLWMRMVCAGLHAAKLRATLSYRFSRPFGAAGLSARLWKMERAEIENYVAMYRNRAIGSGHLAMLIPWSLARFARRAAIILLARR